MLVLTASEVGVTVALPPAMLPSARVTPADIVSGLPSSCSIGPSEKFPPPPVVVLAPPPETLAPPIPLPSAAFTVPVTVI